MNKEVPFLRRATAADYRWSEALHTYTLQFEERFRPGVMADIPAEGAAFYNHYLDQLPAVLAADRAGVDRLRTFIVTLVDGQLSSEFATLARAWVLHVYDAEAFPELTNAELDRLSALSNAEREVLMLAFWFRSQLLTLLTPARLARLRLASA